MSFPYYRPFTVDHTKVPNTDQTNFPVRIAGTFAWAADVAHGGRAQTLFDIRPFADTGLSVALTYQLTSYNPTTGALSMVVLVPSLSHTVDYGFYVGIGDATLTTDGSSASVWDANFKGVYTMGDGTTLSLLDSTSNGNTLTNNNVVAAAAGIVAGMGAASFNGTTQSLSIVSALGGVEPLTLEALFKPSSVPAASAAIVGSSNSGGATLGTRELSARPANIARTTHSSAAGANVDTTALYSTVAWNYGVSVFTSASSRSIALNGTAKVSSGTVLTGLNTGDHFSIGARWANVVSTFYAGLIGEVRISNIVRSDDWVNTTYNNLVGIASFYTVGAEVATVVGGSPLFRPYMFDNTSFSFCGVKR